MVNCKIENEYGRDKPSNGLMLLSSYPTLYAKEEQKSSAR